MNFEVLQIVGKLVLRIHPAKSNGLVFFFTILEQIWNLIDVSFLRKTDLNFI